MNIDDLSKSQLLLLTLLVNFVMSIATGIVTVSLMQQAPPAIAQTVNRIVEHTIETVATTTPKGQTAAVAVVQKTVVVNDTELVAEAIKNFTPSVVRIYTDGTDTQWRATLQRAGVTEEELNGRLQRQIEIEKFVDVRFRAGIRVEDRAISRYYHDEFLPELRNSGAKDVPLDEVSDKIREILTQQRLAEQLAGWIQTLREQAEIRIPPPIPSDAAEAEVSQSK